MHLKSTHFIPTKHTRLRGGTSFGSWVEKLNADGWFLTQFLTTCCKTKPIVNKKTVYFVFIPKIQSTYIASREHRKKLYYLAEEQKLTLRLFYHFLGVRNNIPNLPSYENLDFFLETNHTKTQWKKKRNHTKYQKHKRKQNNKQMENSKTQG